MNGLQFRWHAIDRRYVRCTGQTVFPYLFNIDTDIYEALYIILYSIKAVICVQKKN